MADPTHAIFLSYARDDTAAARRIAEALRSAGLEVWFDENELRGGDQWDAKIRKQIDTCTLFLPIVSRHTQERAKGYFRLEWKLAVDQTHLLAEGVPFLAPVVIDDTREAEAVVPPEFMRVQWTRLPDALPTPQFVEQVRRLLDRKAASVRSTPPMVPGRPRPPVAGGADPGSAPTKPIPRWTWGALTAVVVGIAAALMVARKPTAPTPAPAVPAPSSQPPAAARSAPADRSIAVLPFENRSENKADLYFTDGVHDDLLTQISRIKDIKTISRTSVMTYRGSAKKIREIAGELGVATVLEGGVQRAGNQVRINVQLIDARTDAHLWAETYTRELTAENIFAIQSEIAGAIAKALKGVLSPEDQQHLQRVTTTSFAALEKYFQANALSREPNTASLRRAIVHFQEAISLDAQFAPAYAGLALSYLAQIYSEGLPGETQARLAEPLVEQAIQLDPQLSDAFTARGAVLYARKNVAEARTAFERAIDLKPNNEVAHAYLSSLLFWGLGDREAGLALIQRARELSPEDAFLKRQHAGFLGSLDRYAEARAILEKLVQEDPTDVISLGALGNADCMDGKIVSGFTTLRKAYAMDPGSSVLADSLLQVCADVLGDKEWTKFWLERSVAATRVGKVPLDLRVRLLIVQGKLAEADALWTQEWEPGPANEGLSLWELMLADLKAGRNHAPKARYLKTNPELFAPGATVTDSRNGLFRAKDVALALLAVGERDQAEQLLAQAEKLARGHDDLLHRFILAKVLLARGDRAGFFQTLRDMVARKENLAYYYNDPEFAVFRDDPEFLALFGDLPRQRAEMIATLRRMDASGELAPIPPLPGAKQ